eukprot:s1305_g19.t1
MEAAKSHRTVGVLLNCLGVMAKQDDVLWEMIKSLPLVDGTAPAVRCLREIEKTAMGQRNELLRASEAALDLGVDLPESGNYGSLNVIATATQQRREIQEIFGGLCSQGSMWVREIVCDFSIATVRDGCVKTMISEFKHKLMSVLEAFWPWDLTGVGWVGLADALQGLWS